MNANSMRNLSRYGVLASLLLISSSVIAEKPDWAGRGKHGDRDDGRGQDRGERRDNDRDHERERRDYYQQRDRRDGYQQPPAMVQIRMGGYFDDRRRSEVDNYYREQYRGGHCPPGLAKKNNGCMPPGQARQWNMGRPLPREVAYYPVEPAVQVRLGPAPSGHEFVRVASDILLIAVGTGMVVDAIQDLGGRR
jgi:Ni/Co efflux regulator RcnB